jgi:hypothetical protein
MTTFCFGVYIVNLSMGGGIRAAGNWYVEGRMGGEGRGCSKGENTEGTFIVVWETEQRIKQQRPVREAVYRGGFQMWVKKSDK